MREDHGTSGDAGASIGGKSLAALQGLLDHSTLAVEVGVTAAATVSFVTSSVTPTPEREGDGNTNFVSRTNLHTQRPSKRFVISSDSSHHSSTNVADAEVASLVRFCVPPPPVMAAAVTTTNITGASSAPVLGADAELVSQVHLSIFADSASIGATWLDVASPSNPTDTEQSTDTFYISQEMDFDTLRQIYVLKWNVVNESDVCRGMIDQLAPPGLFSQLRNMDYDQLFVEFNVGAARQTCLSAEVRLRSEHNFRDRKKFKRKYARQVDLLKERDFEIANLKAQLSLKEAEVTEANHLRNQVSVVEATEASQVSELNSLKERNSALEEEKSVLEGKVATLESSAAAKETELASLTTQTAKLTQDLSSLELSCDELSVKVASFESQRDGFADQVKALSDRVAGLDSKLMALSLHLDKEFYPRFLTTIAGRRWIIGHDLRLAVMKCHQSPEYGAAFEAIIGLTIDKGIQAGLVEGIDHGKAGRGLADVASYDPYVEARYVSTVLAFRDLDFKLLSQLESQKDASIADIMSLLRLEAPSAETLEEDNVVTGETSLSDSLGVVHACVQKLKEGALSHHLSSSDAMGVLANLLSSKNLTGEASTLGVPVTVSATTALAISVIAANIISIPPVSVADYDMLDAGVQDTDPHSSKIVFEKEDVETTPEHPSAI
ncbi:hypothetical protein Tco_1328063 [Tanacetum coccineum]